MLDEKHVDLHNSEKRFLISSITHRNGKSGLK